MNERKKIAASTDVETERPHSLVLHPAVLPGGSDLSEVDLENHAVEYFTAAMQSARRIGGLREITLALPTSSNQGQKFLEVQGRQAVETGFELSAVATAEQVMEWGTGAFSNCREVALRIDTVRYPTLKLTPGFFDQVARLQADSRVVSFHVLLTRELIGLLTLPRLRRWLDRADFVTLVAPRGAPADFDRTDLVAFFERLAPLWERADRFFHLHVDRSIKPAFFPWNLLSVTCPAADLALHLGADGRLFLCADMQPFAVLKRPNELAAAVERHLEKADSQADLCSGLPFPR